MTYQPQIVPIGNGASGATEVSDFATGLAALKAGKSVRYVGPGGPTNFDSFHDSTGLFQVDTYTANGGVKVVGNISPAQLRALS